MAQDQHTSTKSTTPQEGYKEYEMNIINLGEGRRFLAAKQPIPLELLSNPVRLEMKIKNDEELASKDKKKNYIAKNKEVLKYIHNELGFEKFPETDIGKIKLEITWKYTVLSEESNLTRKSEIWRKWKAEYKKKINLQNRTDLTTEEKEEVYGLLERVSTFMGDIKVFCNYNVEAIRNHGRAAIIKESSTHRYKVLSVSEALEFYKRKEEIPIRDLPNPVHVMRSITSKKLHKQEAEYDKMEDLLKYILDKISLVSKFRANRDDEVKLELIWMTARQSDMYKHLKERLESWKEEEEVKKDAKAVYNNYRTKKLDFVKKHGLKNNVAVQGLLEKMKHDQDSILQLANTTKPEQRQEQGEYDLGMTLENINRIRAFNATHEYS